MAGFLLQAAGCCAAWNRTALSCRRPPDCAATVISATEIDEAPAGLNPEGAHAYLEARTQGLCHEGALEIAEHVHRCVMTDAARLETVEIKLAHLERALQELSDAVYRQQQQLDAALAMNKLLRQQVEEIDGRGADASAVEIPPHY